MFIILSTEHSLSIVYAENNYPKHWPVRKNVTHANCLISNLHVDMPGYYADKPVVSSERFFLLYCKQRYRILWLTKGKELTSELLLLICIPVKFENW